MQCGGVGWTKSIGQRSMERVDCRRRGTIVIAAIVGRGYIVVAAIIRRGYIVIAAIVGRGYIVIAAIVRRGYIVIAAIVGWDHIVIAAIVRRGDVAAIVGRGNVAAIIGRRGGIRMIRISATVIFNANSHTCDQCSNAASNPAPVIIIFRCSKAGR
ncbi:hypothetical protein NGUA17_00957 [Salmonella enterica]|nr:hypothetical protein NGUA17_00957 [Salmonella enterica]